MKTFWYDDWVRIKKAQNGYIVCAQPPNVEPIEPVTTLYLSFDEVVDFLRRRFNEK